MVKDTLKEREAEPTVKQQMRAFMREFKNKFFFGSGEFTERVSEWVEEKMLFLIEQTRKEEREEVIKKVRSALEEWGDEDREGWKDKLWADWHGRLDKIADGKAGGQMQNWSDFIDEIIEQTRKEERRKLENAICYHFGDEQGEEFINSLKSND